MSRKKKANAAHDLFDDLMDDLAKEDSSSVDSSDETSAKASGFFDMARPDADKEKDAAAAMLTYAGSGDLEGTRAGANVWGTLVANSPEATKAAPLKFDLDPATTVAPAYEQSSIIPDSLLNSQVSSASLKPDVSRIELVKNDDATQAVGLEKTIAVGQNKPAFDHSQFSSAGTSTKYGVDDKVVTPFPSFEKEFKSHVNADASLAQAQVLHLAQDKILSLEKDVDRLRQENDDLAMAADVMRQRSEELQSRVENIEREKVDVFEQGQSEITLLKGQLNYKDLELNKARQKVEEFESRLRTDFKKIRVKERELENRLEIVKAEKQALLRTKDEQILDLQRKIDHLKSELDHHRTKVQDMFKNMENKKDQMRKAVKALRLALTHLEAQTEDLAPTRKRD